MKFPQIALTGVLFLGTIAPVWAVDYDPPNNGAPGDREDPPSDGGSRPGCPEVETPFTALIPVRNWGETMRERPTFWLYVPEEFPDGATVEFVLRDEVTLDKRYETRFQINSGSVVGFELPENAPELDMDTPYRWRFSLFCSPREVESFSVAGVVMRRELNLERREMLAEATPTERVEYLAAWGLWYDALTELEVLRRDRDSSELEEDWEDLLTDPDVGLEVLW